MSSTSKLLLLCAALPLALAVPVRAQNQPVPDINRGPSPARIKPTTAKPHPALPTLEVPGALGVNIHFTDAREGEMEMLRAGGFRVARMDFAWSATEKAKGQYDFSAYDRLIKSLDDHKIQPLFILDYGNPLYDEGVAPHSDEARAAFAKWAATAAAHFKGHKVLWEMYNEPNGDGFWKPKENVDDYIKLALATGRAIRQAAPGECYIGPAVSGMDFRYLEACFKAGLLELWDAVSVHPYRQSDPESVSDEYRRLRLLIERYKPEGKNIPVLSGEWGYSSVWRDFNDERQGKYLPRQWMTNLMNHVPVSIWYDWHDDGTDPKEGEHHFGSTNNAYFAGRTPVYDPKPSYTAARTFSQFFDGFQYNKRLSFARSVEPVPAVGLNSIGKDYLLLFSKGENVKLAVWTTGAEHDVVIPASAGVFKAVNYLGEAQPNLIAAMTGLKVHVSDGPLYLESTAPNEVLGKAAQWTTAPLEYLVTAPNSIGWDILYLNLNTPLGAGAAQRIQRDSPPTFVRSTLVLGSFRLTQTTPVVVANPLNLVVEPAPDKTLRVQVENSLGQPTKGRVALNGGPAQQIEFTDKETEKTLSFPSPPHDPTGAWNASVRFSGSDPQDVVSVGYRFIPLAGFAALTQENLAQKLNAHADGNPEIKSEQTLSVVPNAPAAAPDGGPVLKLTYRFDPGWKFTNVQPVGNTFSTIEGQPKRLGLWVYGDGSGNVIRMRFSDASGQTFQPGGAPINWKGWRYFSFPIDNKGGHWGGANDGEIHGNVKVESLFLLDNANAQNGTQGEIYVAAPSWIY